MGTIENTFEAWTEEGKRATLRGEFASALEAYERARELLPTDADPSRRDAAELNVAMVCLQMGDARRGEDGLREILLRTTDHRIAFNAAYHIASSQRRQGRYDRAMSYATRALDRARAIGALDLVAAGQNLRGNILLYQNRLDDALEAYTEALRLRTAQDGDTRYSRAILLENIGYCRLLRRDYDDGIDLICSAKGLAEDVRDRRCIAECLQDLCYGYLLQGRHRRALEHGERALSEAMDAGYEDIEENCHYLLGELGSKLGDLQRRDDHFQRLQDLHPELPFLREFLCAVDITSIITLKR
jgi:tetratricopeptide (TPR) repeat protein